MSFSQRLRQPVESFRTAPYALSLSAVGSGAIVLESTVACMDSSPPAVRAIMLGLVALDGGCLGLSLEGVKRQFKLRSRLEASIENGYNERIFAVTTQEWCDRQTATVVCESAGFTEEYKQLCQAQRETANLTMLPQI